jgi:hypothetical protein
MSPEAETPEPRLTGEAAYKAELNATAQRNAEAKRSAREHKSPKEVAFVQRERRLGQVETEQLEALNEKLATQRTRRAT